MVAGCTMGTRDIYEYAATAMAPMYLECSTCDTRRDVGPSAAPMIPMDAASFKSNPSNNASKSAAKYQTVRPHRTKHNRLGEQGTKINHGSDTDK